MKVDIAEPNPVLTTSGAKLRGGWKTRRQIWLCSRARCFAEQTSDLACGAGTSGAAAIARSGCQEPSWCENLKIISTISINSENFTWGFLTIDGLRRRPSAGRISLHGRIYRSCVGLAEASLFGDRRAPPDWPRRAPTPRAAPVETRSEAWRSRHGSRAF